MSYKRVALVFWAIFVLIGPLWARTCKITSDKTPPTVNAGGTHTFTSSCPSPVWSVSGPGSINSSTGVYTAPATVWAQDVSRGWQLLPNNNAYKLPINRLPVDSRSSYWLQRVADDHPNFAFYHNFKLDQPGALDFYDNVANNSTPTQPMHFYYGGIYQDTPFPIPHAAQREYAERLVARSSRLVLTGTSSPSIARPGMMPRCITSTSTIEP